MVIGAQSLTIRGYEKSLHGKYFEKLILGSLFQIYGLPILEINDVDKTGFWLSSQDRESRESDATIVHNKKGIRVDIGFIGPGNSEITLDKVSRYLKFDEISGVKFEMSTLIIVDTIGPGSKVRELAKEIDGHIICMSNPNWVYEVYDFISNKLTLKNPMDHINSESDRKSFFRENIKGFDIREFYTNIAVNLKNMGY